MSLRGEGGIGFFNARRTTSSTAFCKKRLAAAKEIEAREVKKKEDRIKCVLLLEKPLRQAGREVDEEEPEQQEEQRQEERQEEREEQREEEQEQHDVHDEEV